MMDDDELYADEGLYGCGHDCDLHRGASGWVSRGLGLRWYGCELCGLARALRADVELPPHPPQPCGARCPVEGDAP